MLDTVEGGWDRHKKIKSAFVDAGGRNRKRRIGWGSGRGYRG